MLWLRILSTSNSMASYGVCVYIVLDNRFKVALKMKQLFCVRKMRAYSIRHVRSLSLSFSLFLYQVKCIPYFQFHRQALFRIHTHLTFSQYPYASRSNDKFVFNSRFVQSNLWRHHIQNIHSWRKKAYIYRNNAMRKRENDVQVVKRERDLRARAFKHTRCSLNSIKSAIIHTWYYMLFTVYMLSTGAHIQIGGEKKPIKYKHDWRALAQLKYSQITHELKIQFL